MKKTKTDTVFKSLFLFYTLLYGSQAYSLEALDEGMSSAFGDSEFVSIATGRQQTLIEAPAVATVITEKDIKASGAMYLEQVLETIPGVHVSVAAKYYVPEIQIRGIRSDFNPHLLMQINGVPMTSLFIGDRGQILGSMPVENISRIEVIRGPGSAVFGADAYSGVINIITKTRDDFDGIQVGGRSGSFATRDAWLLSSMDWNGMDVVSSLQVHKTDGFREQIEVDFQSQLDNLFATPGVSHAPGPVATRGTWLDASVLLAQDNWSLNLLYQRRHDIGTGAGIAEALDPEGDGEGARLILDYGYVMDHLGEDWEGKLRVNFVDLRLKTNLVLFPPGAFGGAFPQGMRGTPSFYERHLRTDASFFYSGITDHLIRVGVGYGIGDMYRIEETKNFNPDSSPTGSIIDVTDTADVFLPENDRNNYFYFVQDEWQFDENWNLTSGVRVDHYSDFGDTINPRLAVVWNIDFDITSKLLYGRAFRAPSFVELFNVNNPAVIGNPDLEPEIINTLEWVLDFHPITSINTRFNVFYYETKDVIRFVPDISGTSFTAQNAAKETGRGIEIEASWKAHDAFRITGNAAFLRSMDDATDESTGHAPQRQFYVRGEWKLMQDLQFSFQVNHIADRKRPANDPRLQLPVTSLPDDFTTVDMVLRYSTQKNWMFSLISRNILDEDVFEPSSSSGRIPGDLPMAGRSAFLEVAYEY